MPDWLVNKGAKPWSPPTGTVGWLVNKGQALFAFLEQEDKSGYINNPRWTPTSHDLDIHFPCGYWWKGSTPGPLLVNLYTLSRNAGFWAGYFNGTILSYIGKYVHPNTLLFGPIRHQESLLISVGTGDSTTVPTIERVQLNPPFALEQVHTPFLVNDIMGRIAFQWGPGLLNGSYFLLAAGHLASGNLAGCQIVRLSETLTRQARGYYGTVVTGTDGQLYGSKTFLVPWNTAWNANYRPITGANWAFEWVLLPDMVCDSPITPWGSGNIMSGGCTQISLTYYGGYLYISSFGLPTIGIRKLDPSTFAILATNGAGGFDTNKSGSHIVARSGVIYVVYGALGAATVKAYSADTLALLYTSSALPGLGSVPEKGIMLGSTHLICWVNSADAGKWKLYKLDYGSLAIVQSNEITLPGQPPHQLELSNYDSQYWMCVYYRGMGIIRASDMTLFQTLDLIPQGWFVNSSMEDVLRADLRIPIPPALSGVNPVWPMPPIV